MGYAILVAVLYAVTTVPFYLAATQPYHLVTGMEKVRVSLFVILAPLLLKYIVQLTFGAFSGVAAKWVAELCPSETQPSVSVLIPAWNEEDGIVKTIKSVLNTKYQKLQVIVINDGSTDSTDDTVARFLCEHDNDMYPGVSFKYLSLDHVGKAKAMNRGLVHVTGEIVITIDADSVMDQDAIANLVKKINKPEIGAVAGNVIIGNRRKPIGWMQQIEYLYGFFFKRADSLFDSVYIVGGTAAAYRKKVLDEVGGFDHEVITEDIEMSTRILRKGYKTRYAADAVIYTEGPSSLKGLCHQRLRWKYGRLQTFIKHRRLFFSLQRQHPPYLTFFLLPLVAYAELLLLFEFVILAVYLIYTIATNDYIHMAWVICLLCMVVYGQILFDRKRRDHRNLILLAPVAWLFFIGMELVEMQAMFRCIKRLATDQEPEWRNGCTGNVILTNKGEDCGNITWFG